MPDPAALAASLSLGGRSLRDLLAVPLEVGFLLNLDNNRRLDFLFNPDGFDEEHSANYQRHGAPGLSHERLQYVGNSNVKIPLELVFDQATYNERRANGGRVFEAFGGPDVQAQNDVDEARRQLLEMVYPRRSQQLSSASPPPVLFHWPGMINMRVRIMKVKFKHKLFQAGKTVTRLLTASVDLEEEALGRLYSEDMLARGTWRPWGSSQQPTRRGR